MTELLELSEIQENISSQLEQTLEKLDAIIDDSKLDVINNIEDLSVFDDYFTIPSVYDQSSTGLKFQLDIALQQILSVFINQRATENGQNLQHIGLLIDLSFYFTEKNIFTAHISLGLIQRLFTELPAEWLLDFWPYLENRITYLKSATPGLVPNKTPGLTFIIAINTRIKEVYGNNEKSHDILRSKLMLLISELFPTFSSHLINKAYETNFEREKDSDISPTPHKQTPFKSFWALQGFFQDPYYPFEKNYRRYIYVFKDMETVFNAILDKEPKGNRTGKVASNEHNSDNSIERYHREDLSEDQQKNLHEFYDNKEFNPTYFFNEEKFNDQLQNDKFFRRSILHQLWITVSFFDSVLRINTQKTDKPLPAKIQQLRDNITKSQERQILDIKRNISDLLANVDKRLFFIGRQLGDSTEFYFIQQKTQLFTDFVKQFSPFEYDNDLKEVLLKRDSFKPKFWAAYGTSQITKHWRQPIGLDLLGKDESIEWQQEIEDSLSKLKDLTKQNNAKELNNWKAFRLARKNNLFKFKQANEETGIEGLYDASIKEKIDEVKREEEQKLLEEQAKLKEERLKQREESENELIEQKKRKASEELTEEARKKVKQSDDEATNEPESADLDY